MVINITREDFFKDKTLLAVCFFLEVISFYLFIIYFNETMFFLIPTALFGFLGLLELWFIMRKEAGK